MNNRLPVRQCRNRRHNGCLALSLSETDKELLPSIHPLNSSTVARGSLGLRLPVPPRSAPGDQCISDVIYLGPGPGPCPWSLAAAAHYESAMPSTTSRIDLPSVDLQSAICNPKISSHPAPSYLVYCLSCIDLPCVKSPAQETPCQACLGFRPVPNAASRVCLTREAAYPPHSIVVVVVVVVAVVAACLISSMQPRRPGAMLRTGCFAVSTVTQCLAKVCTIRYSS